MSTEKPGNSGILHPKFHQVPKWEIPAQAFEPQRLGDRWSEAKGTGFSPYIEFTNLRRGLTPEASSPHLTDTISSSDPAPDAKSL
jgi:hypothetical protein